MIKLCSYNSIDTTGKKLFHIDDTSTNMRKVAGVTLPFDLQGFLKTYTPSSPDVDTYITNAMSSFETYGPNLNGDAFFEPMLKECHPTFVTNSKFFKYHINKPGSPSYGKVVYSTYDDKMHRVLLVIEVFGDKLPAIKERYTSGEPVFVSMGCAVPYDTCSICGNRAKTPRHYCKHLTQERLKIQDDGKMAYMINPHGRFFDISYVIIPADQTAFFITKHNAVENANKIGLTELISSAKENEPFDENVLKVASLNNEEGNEENLISAADVKIDVKDKLATMIKEITSVIKQEIVKPKSGLAKEIESLRTSEKEMNNETIEALAKYPLSDVLSSLLACGIIVKPREFQRLVLLNKGEKEIDRKLENKGIIIKPEDVFNHPGGEFQGVPLDKKNIDYKIIAKVSEFLDKKSYLQPYYNKRVCLNKTANNFRAENNLVNDPDPFFENSIKNAPPLSYGNMSLEQRLDFLPRSILRKAPIIKRVGSNTIPVLSGLGAMYAGYLLNSPDFIENAANKIVETASNKKTISTNASNIGKVLTLLGGAYTIANALNIIAPPLTEKQKIEQGIYKVSGVDKNVFMKSVPYITSALAINELSRNYNNNDIENYVITGDNNKRGFITSAIKNHPLATSILMPIALMKMPLVGNLIKSNPVVVPALSLGGLLMAD